MSLMSYKEHSVHFTQHIIIRITPYCILLMHYAMRFLNVLDFLRDVSSD